MNTEADAEERTDLWHSLPPDEVLRTLHSDPQGLSPADAQARLIRHGPNILPEAPPPSAWRRLLGQFHNLLIYVLLVAASVTAVLQHWLDAAVIVGVVIVNALIGFIQEGKAEDALAAIRQMLSPKAQVIRGAQRTTVPATQVVPGDILPLQAGDKLVADLRLLEVHGLNVDESALTGESVPVEKSVTPCPADYVLADRRCMIYSGTLVTTGTGLGVVVATGADTELGRISTLVGTVARLETPLLRQMDSFARWLTAAIIGLSTLAFAYGVLLHDYLPGEMFLAAVGLAVAAIPEGLPAILTITLAIGVQGMARRNAIIRRLPAVETLGSLELICTDKTGTLTRNEMTVTAIELPGLALSVGGSGRDPHGGFSREGHEYAVADDAAARLLLRAAALCNDAEIRREGRLWKIVGDPMEGALSIAAAKAGIDPREENRRCPRTDLIPFDSRHKFMATLHHDHAGSSFVFVKGAPEQVLARCSGVWSESSPDPIDHGEWSARVERLAGQGYRVLAIAVRQSDSQPTGLRFDDVESGLSLLGLLGLIDPPREEAVAAIATCQRAGIRVKMITGDHGTTALSIARQIGLEGANRVLEGKALNEMDDETLALEAEKVDVYARVTPEHKLRLVQMLQRNGHVVAMTGDGVNDAPALRRADVGVAMGRSGTEVAKESAEMVLTDDNFATIVNAVREGRTVYDNLCKAILFILPTNGGEALVILGAILLGFGHFPLTPVQILWVNMITAATLALALAFEPAERGLMERRPRAPGEAILSRHFLWRVLFVSLILMSGTFGLFTLDLHGGASIEHARTVAVNTLVAFEIFYLFNARFIVGPVLNRRGLFGNRYVWLAIATLVVFQLGFTYLPFMQTLFGTAALSTLSWLKILIVASSVLWLVELEKWLLRARTNRAA